MWSPDFIVEKHSIKLEELLLPGEGRSWLFRTHRTFSHICRVLFSLRDEFFWREAFIILVENIWKKMTCDMGLLLGQENTRGLKEIIFIDNIFYFRQLPRLSLYIWKVPFEKRGAVTMWLQTAAGADKSCHSLSAYRAPDIVMNALQHFFQQYNNHYHLSSSDYVSDRIQSLLLGLFYLMLPIIFSGRY